MNTSTLRIAAAIAVLLVATSAQACTSDNNGRTVCINKEISNDTKAHRRIPYRTHITENGDSIVSHPNGCPHVLFCGCGVSVKVFGRPVKELFAAVEWIRKFPRTAAAPGMVAARRHHVMYIESVDANGNATVYDPNSGGHQTRVHIRSLAGYVIVNPHGSAI